MFGLGKRKPKEIRLHCPACGAGQTESAFALSTFCRACGIHLTIVRGKAVAPQGHQPSALNFPVEDEDEDEPEREPLLMGPGAEPEHLEDEDADAAASARGLGHTWMALSGESLALGDEEEGEEPGDGRSVGVDAAREAPPSGGNPRLGEEARPAVFLKRGHMAALLGGALRGLSVSRGGPEAFRPKLPSTASPASPRKKGAGATREVRCFECNHLQRVSAEAASTQCDRCSVYISLADVVIAGPWSQSVHTRGNILVKRKGAVSGCDLACQDLEVEGRMSASVDCSGQARFCGEARILGSMHCQKLAVEKGADVSFPQGVVTGEAEIRGTVVGDITSAGAIRIRKGASVTGDVTARSVDLRDGGKLVGLMTIRTDVDISLPEKRGYLKNHLAGQESD